MVGVLVLVEVGDGMVGYASHVLGEEKGKMDEWACR